MKSVSLVIPTYNAGALWSQVIKSILVQNYPGLHVLVIDSGSRDNTYKLAVDAGFDVVSIDACEFNHGGTRNRGVRLLTACDVVVFMTQDAILATDDAISNMVAHFDNDQVGAVCGRQLPHIDANPLAAHARRFNYPAVTIVKSKDDIKTLGIKAAFMSNSFSAYRVSSFNQVGGFPSHTILSEDMYIAAKLILAGAKIVYAADAAVHHSHNYTLLQEFKRYFDIGVFHADQSWIRTSFGGAGGEGRRYLISELEDAISYGLYWFLRSVFANGVKLLGYKLGQMYKRLPLGLIKRCSMHVRYWER